MDSRKIVFKETAVLALGTVLCTAAMYGVFALLQMFSAQVLLGGLLGCVLSIGNFFFMAVGVSLAADRAQQQDVPGGQKLLKQSYPIRCLLLALILVACAKSGWFDVLALALPLLFARPILTIAEFFRKKGD